MRSIRRQLTVVALALAAGSGAARASLLSNGEFSNFTTSPWVVSQGNLYLAALDRQNNSSSGSALVVDSNGSIIAASFLSECVRIAGGANADVAAWFKVGAKNPSGSRIRVGRFYYSDSSCGGSTYLGGINSGFLAVPTNWTKVAHANSAPLQARSARVEIVVNSGSGAIFEVYVDGATFGSGTGGTPATIFNSGFESGGFNGWTASN